MGRATFALVPDERVDFRVAASMAVVNAQGKTVLHGTGSAAVLLDGLGVLHAQSCA